MSALPLSLIKGVGGGLVKRMIGPIPSSLASQNVSPPQKLHSFSYSTSSFSSYLNSKSIWASDFLSSRKLVLRYISSTSISLDKKNNNKPKDDIEENNEKNDIDDPKAEPKTDTSLPDEADSSEKTVKDFEKTDTDDISPKTDSTDNSETSDKDEPASEDGLANSLNVIRKAFQVLDPPAQKPSVPENYPQVLALPITRRPLFPGFYKAVVVKNPEVISAIKELMKKGQPYVGAFLLKDDSLDVDTVEELDRVYNVGVFAQITSVFPSNSGEENSLTAVLYPHRRIRMTNVFTDPVSSTLETTTDDNKPIETSFEPIVDFPDRSSVVSAIIKGKFAASVADIENLVDEPCNKRNPMVRAITTEMVSAFKDIAALNSFFRDQIANFSVAQYAGNVFDEPGKLADFAAAMSAGEPREVQDVLESLVIEERLQKSLVLLKKELMNAQLQSKISKDVDAKIAKRQREYYLMEQLKGIKAELGLESDGKDKLLEQFRERALALTMPEEARKVFDEEISKLSHLEPASSEFNVTRNYLDWLTVVPWGKRGPENYDLMNAMKVLDEDHYGLKDVKERILEFIAVGKLRGSVEGKIICLSGPPGVGKTSIGKSIARALGREFYRFSVGGLTDVAEIKGHRRTYVGAMPGKVVQALKKVQTENPLILIDEIDKVGRGHQGDPSSALLELLDPEQNGSFLDHYMDVHIDLSRVLFVCTANVTDTIPGPLLDRMEVIQLSGYIADEKAAIAGRYLGPQAKEACGLENANVTLTNPAIELLIKAYCRESGVRSLKKHIEKIYRKVAYQLVKNVESKESTAEETKRPKSKSKKAVKQPPPLDVSNEAAEVTAENLKDFVGPPLFTSDRLYDTTPPGVVMGLAWTSMGGSSLYIETVLQSPVTANSKSCLTTTGHLGDVMKESTTIAYTFARSYITRKFPDNRFFEKASIHLHVPEGATPKDGPSAGITMTTSMVSLALDSPIPATIAMTGEITLTGKVLKIGGLKEKTIAAKRSGVTDIICPASNRPDWEELPDHVKEGMSAHFVEWFDEIPPIVQLTTDSRAPDWLKKNPLTDDS